MLSLTKAKPKILILELVYYEKGFQTTFLIIENQFSFGMHAPKLKQKTHKTFSRVCISKL